ncbi:MAG TPA: hypothetical protein VHO71_04645 [Caproiciproducens sp.]|nr:hypothetical protein [Caproiciproducens sp.]
MDKTIKPSKDIDKQAEYSGELKKLNDLFANVDESKRDLVSGLIENAAYLYAENKYLCSLLAETGMVRINPQNPKQQRPIEAAKQYRSNLDTYSTVIGKLARILDAQQPEEDDDMGEFEDE